MDTSPRITNSEYRRFEERKSLSSRADISGVKSVGIDTSFVNPAFKPEVPDYRTESEIVSKIVHEPDKIDEEESIEHTIETKDPGGVAKNLTIVHEVMPPEPKQEVVTDLVSRKARQEEPKDIVVPEIDDQAGVASIMARLKQVPSPNKNEISPVISASTTDVTNVSTENASTVDESHSFSNNEQQPTNEQHKNEKLIAKIEQEIKDLNTDLNLLAQETGARKADLVNRKNYRSAVRDVHEYFETCQKEMTEFDTELVSEKMEHIRDLHETIFDFETKPAEPNNIVHEYMPTPAATSEEHSENETTDASASEIAQHTSISMKRSIPVKTETEIVATAFSEPVEQKVIPDESSYRLSDVKDDVIKKESVMKKQESHKDESEIVSAAENLMVRELRNKGMQKEWESGNFWGISRPLSEMRFDEFRDLKIQYRAWLTDLQERAGDFVPIEEPSIKMDEYLKKLYIGIIKTQYQVDKNSRNGERTRLLGI